MTGMTAAPKRTNSLEKGSLFQSEKILCQPAIIRDLKRKTEKQRILILY